MENFFANVDVVNFILRDGELHVSLWRRQHEPAAGMLALPGAIINGTTRDASLEDTVSRVIGERLGQTPLYMEQVMTVGNATRDPRGWSMSTVYLSLHTDEAHGEHIELVPYAAILNEEIALPFDHRALILGARERLLSKSTYSSLPLLFLPKDGFTVPELIQAYRTAMNAQVQPMTVRTRVELMEKKGEVRFIRRDATQQGRPKRIYAHDQRVHYFERSILARASRQPVKAGDQAAP